MTWKVNPNTCEFCPHRHGKGCPAWITPEYGFMEQNIHTGEERIVTGCFYQVMPKLMMHVVQAANKPAAAFESLRNETMQGFQAVAEVLQFQQGPPTHYRVLEDKRDADTKKEQGGNQS